MGKFDSKQGSVVSTQDQEPWEAQQPHLKNIFGRASQLYDAPGPKYYPGQTYTPFAPETEAALGMKGERARLGSPLTRAAKGHVLETIAGARPNRFLGGLKATAAGGAANPYLDALYERASRPVLESFRDVVAPSIAGRFMGAGRFGSGAMKDVLARGTGILGRTLGDLSASIYAPAYEAERGRQVGAQHRLADIGETELGRRGEAARFAPSLATTDYGDIANLEAVGRSREELGQRQIQDAINRFEFEQQKPASKLAQYLQFIQGNYGGAMRETQPIFRNPGAGFLGGAATGAGIGQMLGWQNPWLAALGGGILGMR